jgi:serine/threonine protein kinase
LAYGWLWGPRDALSLVSIGSRDISFLSVLFSSLFSFISAWYTLGTMSISQSGRPETSAPASSFASNSTDSHAGVTGTIQPADAGEELEKDGPFVPHVFDFISIAQRAAQAVGFRIPSMFLEAHAVDSSNLIGQGASFVASRVPVVQEASTAIQWTTKPGSFLLEAHEASRMERPQIVYKTVRIQFTNGGSPTSRDQKAMSSAMMEIYALAHPPLARHENIVKLLGLAWGSNPYEPSHLLPVPIVEYADLGTLQDLQARETLPSEGKRRVCLDIALGLDALHGCGLVHGDVKPENVLMFAHNDRKYIAKVADFGFSVVEATARDTMYIGGTHPWRAPEASGPIAKSQLKATDVYSFGLLVWSVAIDGRNPFRLGLPQDLTIKDMLEEADRLKKSDRVLTKSMLKEWYPTYYTQLVNAKSRESLPIPQLLQTLTTYGQHIQNIQAMAGTMGSDEIEILFEHVVTALTALGLDVKDYSHAFVEKARIDVFYKCIDSVMENSLTDDPSTRDLQKVIDALLEATEVRPR